MVWVYCFKYLEEIFHTLGIITVALSADPLHFFDLSSLTGSLDVLEMHIRVLAEVYNAAQEVEQACKKAKEFTLVI